MPVATDDLIDRLARDLTPVRPLRPPLLRAVLWLLIFLAFAAAAVATFSDLPGFMARARHLPLMVELAATLVTGILATLAAFYLSLPDRGDGWLLLPLPSLIVWVGASGTGCYQDWLRLGTRRSWVLGESADCLMFILGIGLPVAAMLLWSLRRSRPLNPVRVAAMGALGAASLTAFLLQFFHPFDVTFMDLAIHAGAISVIVVAAAWRGPTLFGMGPGSNGSRADVSVPRGEGTRHP